MYNMRERLCELAKASLCPNFWTQEKRHNLGE